MSRQIGLTAKRRKYDAGVVNHAADLVKSGTLSLSKAAKTYQIPKTTLHDRVHGKYETDHIGVKTVLTTEEEQRIAAWALHMSKIGYGRNRAELTGVVKSILDADGRKTPFTDNRPGRQWLRKFFERHPELTIRTTIQFGKERAIISREKVNRWFDDFKNYIMYEVKDPSVLTDPTRIYNADESGFSLCASKGSKVVGSKGAPVVYHFGNSDKTQMTVMAAASASGHFVQPMIIYPGQRFGYNPLEGFEEAAFGRSENGWMDSEVFVCWLKNVFVPSVEARQVKKPVLLLIDGHKTHVSMEASNTCLQHGIELYCLLEHSSHVMQPLDLRFFSTLKTAWRQSVRDWQSAHIGEFVTKQTFARVFKPAWMASATVEAAVKGFQEAGLFPLVPDRVIKSVKLDPSMVFTSVCTSESLPDTKMSGSNIKIAAPMSSTKLPKAAAIAASVASFTATDVTDVAQSTNVTATIMCAADESASSKIATNVTEATLVADCATAESQCHAPTSNIYSATVTAINDTSATLIASDANGTTAVTCIQEATTVSPIEHTPTTLQTSDSTKVTPSASGDCVPFSMSSDVTAAIPIHSGAAGAMPHSPSSNSNTPAASDHKPVSPFSKFLQVPNPIKSKPKVSRVLLPKAITGSTYRKMLQEKMEMKQKLEEQKLKRKQERNEKKLMRDEEKKRKHAEQQQKRAAREEEKKKRTERKRLKEAREEQILKEIDASDSDDGQPIDKKKCYSCEQTYEDYIECTNCARRFHIVCVEHELICDELDFECKYC